MLEPLPISKYIAKLPGGCVIRDGIGARLLELEFKRKSATLAEDCSADDADKVACKQHLITVFQDRRNAIAQIQ